MYYITLYFNGLTLRKFVSVDCCGEVKFAYHKCLCRTTHFWKFPTNNEDWCTQSTNKNNYLALLAVFLAWRRQSTLTVYIYGINNAKLAFLTSIIKLPAPTHKSRNNKYCTPILYYTYFLYIQNCLINCFCFCNVIHIYG